MTNNKPKPMFPVSRESIEDYFRKSNRQEKNSELPLRSSDDKIKTDYTRGISISYTPKGLDLTKLLKVNKPIFSGSLEDRSQVEFARLFGVEPSFFLGLIKGFKWNSKYYTKEQLAIKLVDAKLVNNIQEGLIEIEPYIDKHHPKAVRDNSYKYTRFFEFNSKRGIVYQLRYLGDVYGDYI